MNHCIAVALEQIEREESQICRYVVGITRGPPCYVVVALEGGK